MRTIRLKDQTMFNRVWNHFIRDKQPFSYSTGKGCRYRGPHGAKCAVGVLIPDDRYRQEFEGTTGTSMNVRKVFELANLELNVNLADAMQEAHDDCAISCNYTASWRRAELELRMQLELRMRDIATAFSLRIPGERRRQA